MFLTRASSARDSSGNAARRINAGLDRGEQPIMCAPHIKNLSRHNAAMLWPEADAPWPDNLALLASQYGCLQDKFKNNIRRCYYG